MSDRFQPLPKQGREHDHIFGADRVRAGERRTWIVVAITASMMVIEIWAGIVTGSMALLADGLHMGSHTVALLISVVGYVLVRRLSGDPRFSFGTGKINSLAAFASAVLLAGLAFAMAFESITRLVNPSPISVDQALVVAVIGLAVNGGCAWLLMTTPHEHGHHHSAHDHDHPGHSHDHNLRAAYLHVLADAITSLLAIIALIAAKYAGALWLDPLMGIIGAVLVTHWSVGLLRSSGKVLLDWQADEDITSAVRSAIESRHGDAVTDLHVWSLGEGRFSAAITVVSDAPGSPDGYRDLMPNDLGIVHATIEVHQRAV